MSATLYWEPIIDRGNSLSDTLKYAFRDRYLGERSSEILSSQDISYLEGLKAGTIDEKVKKEIDTLIANINKYTAIKIYLRY